MEQLMEGLVMSSENGTIDGGVGNELRKWTEAVDIEGLGVNVGKTNVMAIGAITKDDLSKSKVYPCGISGLSVKANSVLYVQCGKWIHIGCVGVENVTPKSSINYSYRKCEQSE